MNKILLLISIFVTLMWYKNANCKTCKLESILIGILLLQFNKNEMLLLKLFVIFIFGEIVIRFISKK